MKRMKLSDLPASGVYHILQNIIPGQYLCQGGLSFKTPGQRTHDLGCECDACDGQGRHIHVHDSEVFIILQGKAVMEIDGRKHCLSSGDVIVCEAGEDHHLVSDTDDPCVNLYLHAGDVKHVDQQ